MEETINVIKCPHCKMEIEPWDYILEIYDMEGDFTIYCENPKCKKEFSVSYNTKYYFKTNEID